MQAEVNALNNAGKTVDNFRVMTMYTTLMSCNMRASVRFRIGKIIVGEAETFQEHGLDLLTQQGVEVIDLDLDEAQELLASFIDPHPDEWCEDIGR